MSKRYLGGYITTSFDPLLFTAAPSSLIPSNLVLWYDFGNSSSYPGSGTAITDLSGTSNNGTLSAATTYNTSPSRLTFANASQITSTTSYANPQAFTVGIWFKTSTASGKKICGFENPQTGTSPTSYDRQFWVGSTGLLKWGVYSGTTNIFNTNITVTDNTWREAVCSYTGGVSTIYVNGSSLGTVSGTAENFTGWWRVAGYGLTSWESLSNGYWTGDIGMFYVYSSALNSTDISTNFNTFRSRFGV